MTWAQRILTDPSLRAFVEAHCAQEVMALNTLRIEYAHAQGLIKHQAEKIAALERQIEGKAPKAEPPRPEDGLF